MKLRTKLLGFLVPLVVIPLLILGWIGFNQLRSEARQTVLREMNTLQTQVARNANTRLRNALSNAKLFSESGLIKSFLFSEEDERYRFILLPLLELFSGYNRAYPEYYRIQVVSPSGEELARYSSLVSTIEPGEEVINPTFFKRISNDSSPSHAEYRFDPEKGEWSLVVSQKLNFIDPTFEDSTIALPSLRGYLVLTVSLEDLREQVVQNRLGETGQIFFTSPEGEIMFRGTSPIDEHSLPKASFRKLQSVLDTQEPTDIELGETSFIAEAKTIEGGPLLISILPKAELTRSGRELGLIVFGICVVSILITIVCLLLILKFMVTAPLKKLGDGAKQIESGNLGIEIEVEGNSELTELAKQFNAMARGIQENKRLRDSAQAEALQNKELAITSLEKADRLKDEFLANTSHELRTPLHGMTGIAESLLNGSAGPFPEDARKNLELIVTGGRRLAHLVNDILDFSKLQNDELRLSMNSVDVQSVCNLVITTLQPTVEKRDIHLTMNISESLPLVEADENRLQQILYNIIGNALKFTEKGTVAVEASTRDEWVEVSVSDTGMGIPSDHLQTIFDSFQQLDSAADRTQGGTGLGLTITRKLIESQGGTIRVESTVGQGSVFTFSLPIALDQSPPSRQEITLSPKLEKDIPAEILPATYESENSRKEITSGKNRTILVVDDEPMNLQVVKNHLSGNQMTIHLASSGKEALDWLETSETTPDLILLDVMMPRMNGFKVCEKIRETFSPTELPIIFLTARNRPEDIAHGIAIGGNDYIPKPFAHAEFFARIQLHLELAISARERRDWTQTLEDRVQERTEDLERANRKLEKQNEVLIENENLRQDIERMTQHDLRSPIAGIISLAEIILEDGKFGDESFELRSIIDSGYEVLDMIARSQDMHKMEKGTYNLVPENFDLIDVLFRIDADTKDLREAKESKLIHRLREREASDCDSCPIKADKSLIYLALSNLINNAFEATPPRENVEVTIKPSSTSIEINIHNQGTIPENVRSRFFEKYATAGKRKGNGLGTYSALLIVKQHGGMLSFTTEEGTGTTLRMVLPNS